MSFQFSPETFIREIDFQIEQIQSDIDNLSTSLNNELDRGPPEKVAARFEAPGLARFGVPKIPAILNKREVDANREAIASFDRSVKDLTKRISTLETKINDLLTQRRIFQTEIDVRAGIPDSEIQPTLIVPTQEQPTLIVPTQEQPKINFKQVAVLIGIGVLVL